MNISPEWQNILFKYKDFVFIVEGKKDTLALNALGFERVYEIHNPGISLLERIEDIIRELDKKDTVCILTDFDKKGKELYFIIRREMQTLGVRLNSSLRNILLRMHISHIEGLDSFVETHTLEN